MPWTHTTSRQLMRLNRESSGLYDFEKGLSGEYCGLSGMKLGFGETVGRFACGSHGAFGAKNGSGGRLDGRYLRS